MKILDLGCGNKKREGAIGVDFNSRTKADVIHNLNVFPYPFEVNYFDQVFIDNTLEHLDEVLGTMEEVCRITKVGGEVKVIVPYFRSAWACIDPTHKHFFTANSFAYFDPENPICIRYDYTLARLKTKKIVFNETLENGFFKRIICKFANRFPNFYEFHLSHLYPLDDISFYLIKL